jgi:hypothetical protein
MQKQLKAGVKLSLNDKRDLLLDEVIHDFYNSLEDDDDKNKKRVSKYHTNVDIIDVLFNEKKQSFIKIDVPDKSLILNNNNQSIVDTKLQVEIWKEYIKGSKMRNPIDVIDQGYTSICVCASGVTTKHFQEIDVDNRETLNPYFLYNCRSSQKEDNGMSVRNMLTVLYKYGCPSMAVYPYKDVITSKNGKPSIKVDSQVFASAAKHKVAGYGRIYSLSSLLDATDLNKTNRYKNQFGSFMIVLPVYNTGMIYWLPNQDKKQKETDLYHCASIIDYDLDLEVLKIQNSWGKNWGDDGCFYFPFSHWIPFVIECWFSSKSTEFVSNLKQKLLDRKNIANYENYQNGDLEIDNKKQPADFVTNTEFLNSQYEKQDNELPKKISSTKPRFLSGKIAPLLNKIRIRKKQK